MTMKMAENFEMLLEGALICGVSILATWLVAGCPGAEWLVR